jgi:monofunctional biosynthetic peptidoglycan transglycosylase
LTGVGATHRLAVHSDIAAAGLFFARIALMRVVDPQSTTFQRSEATRLLQKHGKFLWSQHWTEYGRISEHLKRAVIASQGPQEMSSTFPPPKGVKQSGKATFA